MKTLNSIIVFLGLVICPFLTQAQPQCIAVDRIAKWEVLDSTKTIVYDPQGNSIAFIIFSSAAFLKKSGENFRFFSPTICVYDRVQTTAGMTTVNGIEPIRK